MYVHKHERLSNFTLKTKELCFYFSSILYMFLFLFYIIHVFISVLYYTCFYFYSILYMFLFLFYIIHVFISVLYYTCFYFCSILYMFLFLFYIIHVFLLSFLLGPSWSSIVGFITTYAISAYHQ